ncbi:hypothetical protein [Azospirillum sp. HJ39]|uniref:hypothetical protein n=1 Tax=Azospirillum sp. HJ39 TaxID=3159496 RepID=UPI00355710A7
MGRLKRTIEYLTLGPLTRWRLLLQNVDERPQGGSDMPVAGIVEREPRDWWAPVFKDRHQATVVEKPPFRLVLGSTAYTSISKALAEQLRELETQHAVAFSADTDT